MSSDTVHLKPPHHVLRSRMHAKTMHYRPSDLNSFNNLIIAVVGLRTLWALRKASEVSVLKAPPQSFRRVRGFRLPTCWGTEHELKPQRNVVS